MLRTYLDANATIYFVERIDPYYPGIKKRVLDSNGAPLITCTISELLLMEVRVRHRVKTPDALHLAAAINAGCDQFWTNDDRLAKAAEGHIEVINIGETHGTNT